MNAKNVKRIRAKLWLTQSQFADLLGLSVRTVQDWEQGQNTPGAPAAALLKLADSGALKKRKR
jgi:putative transcriptional regulator